MAQMHARMEGDCAVRGEGSPITLVAAPDDLLSRAALISLAKGLDTAESSLAVRLCVGGEGQAFRLDAPLAPGGDPDWKAAEARLRTFFGELTRR